MVKVMIADDNIDLNSMYCKFLTNDKSIEVVSSTTDGEKKKQLKEVQKQINELAKDSLEQIKTMKNTETTAKIGEEEYYKYHGVWTKLKDEEKEKNKNISLKSYAEYKNQVYGLTQSKRKSGELTSKQQLKNKDKIGIILNSNFSEKEKEEIYKKYINSEDKKIQLVDKLNFPLIEYLKYKQQDFKNDKDKDGETISGTKKKKVAKYLASISNKQLPMEYKKIICKIEGVSKIKGVENLDSDVARFVNSYKGLKFDDKKEILESIGFNVDKKGKVTSTIILPIKKSVK